MDIQVKNLNKEYVNSTKNKKHVLHDLSLNIYDGEFVSIIGRSGSGKSTFLRILGGLETITTGTVMFQDKSIVEFSRAQMDMHRSNDIGFVFQDSNLLDGLTVKENIMLPLVINKVDKRKVLFETNSIMAYMGISNIEDSFPHQISGGEQQRTSACRAVIKNPKIILADEPTGNLDYHSSTILLNMLKKINSEQKRTIIMVTHDAYSASFSNRVVIFHDGSNTKEILKDCHQNEFENKIYFEMHRLSQAGDKVGH